MRLTTLFAAVLVVAGLAWDVLGGPLPVGLPAVSVPLFHRSSVALAAAFLLLGRGAPLRPFVSGLGAVACLGRVLLVTGYVSGSPLRTAWLAVDVVGALLWLSVTVRLAEGLDD